MQKRTATPSYPSDFIQAECILLEQFAPTAFHASLPNGKQTVAFVQKREAHLLPLMNPGARVLVTICPADFDRARIRSIVSD